MLLPGQRLVVLVEVATGLTPPPGVQEERAHRAFALALCADGIDLGAGARRCFPLPIANLRPSDGTSLRYRLEAVLPIWLAPGRYLLQLRFPGGSAQAAEALVVRGAGSDDALPPPEVERATPHELVLRGGAAGSRLRVHAGAGGFTLRGGSFEAYPLPDPVAGMAPGFVGLIHVPAGERVFVTKRQSARALSLHISQPATEVGRVVTLRAQGAPGDSRLFWWMENGGVGQGSAFTARFLYPGKQRIQLLAVTPDGRTARLEAALPIWQRRARGCALGGPQSAGLDILGCVGLLVLSRSWKLRRRLRPGRRGAC